jgi:PIN domain nuclease of toxin-antitoxin system
VIVLDTHAWLWWLHEPRRLSRPARSAVEKEVAGPAGSALVSAISVWEVAVKVQLGKLALPMDVEAWFGLARTYPGVAVEPVDPLDAIASTRLPGALHKDPADRMIVARARRHDVPLVTRDRRLRAYPHVRTIW